MKLRLPNYYKDFKCIADKCKDSCCAAGWEIDIDDKSAEFYRNIEGDFGDKLRKNIECVENCDNNQFHFILNKHHKCPFFNKNGLCDIYTNLGKNTLCQICAEHPRFYEWFDGIKEGGIGLCCEQAAHIIMCDNNPFGTYEIDIPYEDCDEYDNEIFEYLSLARNKIINYMNNETISLNSRIRNILWYSYMIQQDLDCELLDDEEIIDNVGIDTLTHVIDNTKISIINNILDFYKTLDFNDKDYLNWLQSCKNCNVSHDKFAEFMKTNPNIQKYLKNIYIYFIWRYFMKGCFDGEILSKIKIATISVIIIQYLWFCKWMTNCNILLDDMITIAKKYSEEIEYSEDNLLNFSQATYDINVFSIDNLIKF